MSNIVTRPLGKNGPDVVGMGLGLMGLSFAYGPAMPDSERYAVLDAAYEIGERFWDSADIYGDSEDLLGRWFKANPGKRENIFLATKFANRLGAASEEDIKSGEANTTRSVAARRFVDSSPEWAKEACALSLKRLGVDCIDLYYAHRVDGKTPIEKTVKAMAELKAEGKIKYLGLSEVSATTLRRAHAVHPITAVQMEYSPWELSIESEQTDFLRTCRELGVAVVAYSPVGRGMLTGTIRSRSDFGPNDFRAFSPRFSEENFHKNLEIVDKIEALAKEKGVTTTQLVLAWLVSQGEDIFPIPGTTKIPRLKENFGALQIKLTEKESKDLRELVDASVTFGERYPTTHINSLFGETPPLES